ncbi:high light inducible protein [Acaryochloris sp. IP29b_bin.148]|uniref:high light inducible protein n=1 Tax=Acaryochloris sp. IP29b_bin.148 TaxID=2969218 RepID=UPI00260615CD|nr:high light inducible protein [Acaryochloris sp. IP29b_bin.148]
MSIKDQTWGFNSFAETFSGRLAMYGFFIALITEVLTGKGIIGQLTAFFFFVN